MWAGGWEGAEEGAPGTAAGGPSFAETRGRQPLLLQLRETEEAVEEPQAAPRPLLPLALPELQLAAAPRQPMTHAASVPAQRRRAPHPARGRRRGRSPAQVRQGAWAMPPPHHSPLATVPPPPLRTQPQAEEKPCVHLRGARQPPSQLPSLRPAPPRRPAAAPAAALQARLPPPQLSPAASRGRPQRGSRGAVRSLPVTLVSAPPLLLLASGWPLRTTRVQRRRHRRRSEDTPRLRVTPSGDTRLHRAQ